VEAFMARYANNDQVTLQLGGGAEGQMNPVLNMVNSILLRQIRNTLVNPVLEAYQAVGYQLDDHCTYRARSGEMVGGTLREMVILAFEKMVNIDQGDDIFFAISLPVKKGHSENQRLRVIVQGLIVKAITLLMASTGQNPTTSCPSDFGMFLGNNIYYCNSTWRVEPSHQSRYGFTQGLLQPNPGAPLQKVVEFLASGRAIGGAVTALGGDLSAAYVNPAGLGLYRTSELIFTPSFHFNSTKADYLNTEKKEKKNAVDYNNFGMVLPRDGTVANFHELLIC